MPKSPFNSRLRRDPAELRETAEALVHLTRQLNEACREGGMVIVEGPRDTVALRALGFEGHSYAACYNSDLDKLLKEAARYTRTIILLDMDTEGRRLTGQITSLLQEKGIKADLSYRRMLHAVLKGRISTVEELSRFAAYIDR